jgi:hypothetical protein
LQQRIWDHHVRGGDAAPLQADQPGGQNSGACWEQEENKIQANNLTTRRSERSGVSESVFCAGFCGK